MGRSLCWRWAPCVQLVWLVLSSWHTCPACSKPLKRYEEGVNKGLVLNAVLGARQTLTTHPSFLTPSQYRNRGKETYLSK